MSDVIEVHGADELHLAVYDGEDVVLAVADLRSHVAKRHVWIKYTVVVLNHAVHTHQSEYGMVGVMCQKFASLRQSHCIYAVWLESLNGEIRANGHNHQWHEQAVAASQLGN